MTKINIDWFKAAATRAIKTFAQVILGMVSVGAAFDDVVWIRVLSVAAVATILSLLTSLAGLPETGQDGTLSVNTSDPEKDVYSLKLDDSLEALAEKSTVIFKVLK